MKLLICLAIYFLSNLNDVQSKIVNYEENIGQGNSLNRFTFGTNGCLFQGCECSTKSSPDLSVACDGQIYQHFKVMFPLRKDQSKAKINDFLLMHHNFYSIPPQIFQGLDIKNLVFVDNRFDSIFFDSFAKISSLQSLEFYDNSFYEIDKDSFAPLFDKISRLVFYGNGLTEDAARKVKNSIENFKNLTFLAIENFDLDDSSEWLKINSKNLRVLDLSINKLKSFSFFVNSGNNSFKYLTELYLSSNALGPLFYLSNLNTFSSLQVLDLSKNNIQDFSTESHVFKNLEKLDLSQNMLKFVYRDYFKNMPSLIELNLQNNLIYQIDIDSFHHNPSLATLVLSNNQINYLDSMLTDSLQKLKNFQVHTNYLDTMPSIYNMTNLEVLDISNQQVLVFNVPDYSFDRLKSLTKMSVSLVGSPGLMLNFGNKAFCSKDKKTILDYIEFTHLNIPKSNVCLLGQLKNSTIDLFRKTDSKFLYDFTRNKICNCYLIDYFYTQDINFGRSCKIDLNKCEEDFFQQQDQIDFNLDCKSREKYEC
ncbi:chaoptin isoform X3 [Brachionus plicatilis]|uniref:Chaoptin isoform X3 n=1 Tax=Brachionus plicatilis TaxID=10195 RepID=A0A3M7R406_BRAPC|nr:chaoptin isoform X3 [Brachionus plicatilis]